MKKLMIALTAALGLGAASVPAMAGGSYSVSGYVNAPISYGYGYTTPYYGSTSYYTPSYVAPTYYSSPTYYGYSSFPTVSYGFGSAYTTPTYYGHGKYRSFGHRSHRGHHRGFHGHRW